jgi:actin-related protein 2
LEIKIDINIIDPPRRRFNVFIGGGVLAKTMKDKPDYWISREEYKEYGAE